LAEHLDSQFFCQSKYHTLINAFFSISMDVKAAHWAIFNKGFGVRIWQHTGVHWLASLYTKDKLLKRQTQPKALPGINLNKPAA
jgi:hypothetical protein